jgi:hypothetical protein
MNSLRPAALFYQLLGSVLDVEVAGLSEGGGPGAAHGVDLEPLGIQHQHVDARGALEHVVEPPHLTSMSPAAEIQLSRIRQSHTISAQSYSPRVSNERETPKSLVGICQRLPARHAAVAKLSHIYAKFASLGNSGRRVRPNKQTPSFKEMHDAY